MFTYEQWCENNTNIKPLIRSLKSSLPEQYIGFYLHTVFGNEIEYQKQFTWLGRYSLDIFIPSLRLAVEYDGIYYHSYRKESDKSKNNLCKKNGISIIHICEADNNIIVSNKLNTIVYFPNKDYSNIGIAVNDLCSLINKSYNQSLYFNVDIKRDFEEIELCTKARLAALFKACN